jgi:methionyl aminopeptidase
MIARNDLCWCGSGKKWKKCHYPEKNTLFSFEEKRSFYKKRYNILLKTPEQIEGIKRACKLSASILDKLCKAAVLGVTTNYLNDLAIKLNRDAKAIPATLGYGSPPFSKAICTSINEVICHGIPDDRPLQDGDILNIDTTSILNGYYGDCSAMVMIGNVTDEKKHLVFTAKKCLDEAIKIVKPGLEIYKIGDKIEQIAKENGCSVVYQFVAHGVGVDFHEEPQIAHHKNRMMIPLEEGMTFTIEPMINLGEPDAEIDKKDKWTARTVDGKPSAQWEHTILVTKEGFEILTIADTIS